MRPYYLVIPFSLGLMLAVSCGDDVPSSSDGSESDSGETGECSIGSEGCPCTAGGSCDTGLVCMVDTCVDPGGDGDGDGDPLNCGDTVIDYDLGEQCDDGNNMDNDGCSSDCQVEVGPECGDGNLQLANGEECDDGNTIDDDGCSANCQLEPLGLTCGDNTVDPGEVCDDGNLQNGDSCNPTCNLGNSTSLFAGGPGIPGLLDGVGQNARFGNVGNLAIDNDYVYVSDGPNNCIRRIEIATATVLTIAGDGIGGTTGDVDDPVGLNARFQGVGAITTDGSTLWVADGGNHKLKAVDLTPPYAVTTVAGNGNQQHLDGIGQNAGFFEMRALTYYAGQVYLLDGTVAVLRRYDANSDAVLTIAGQANNPGIADGMGFNAQFLSPRYIASDNSGMLYIADTNGYHIRSYNIATTFVGTFAGNGAPGYLDGTGLNAAIHRPRGMTSDGTSIYFTEFNHHTIRQGVLATAEISTLVGTSCGNIMGNCNGGYTEAVGAAAVLDGPFDVVFHYPSNSLFFFDGANNVVRRIQ